MATKTQGAWLLIVGIGEDGWEGLRTDARRAIASADLLFGSVRHLAHVPEATGKAVRVGWPSPMAPAIREILELHRGQRRIVVLASGDPMLYGIGVTLTRDLDLEEFCVIPQVSAFSLACARMGWPAVETVLISMVNRPVEQIHRHLVTGQRLVLYSENGSTPAIVARLLTESGYGGTKLHVFENLDGKTEQHHSHLAAAWPAQPCGPLNLIALTCEADAGITPLPLVPGLPEDAFETDGQLTKREVRAATLARLAPLPGQTLWDVGAGTGTIGIEWMRVHPSCRCVAFEERSDRAARIMKNAARLGVPALKVVEGSAPGSFEDLPSPQAIFLGGGVSGTGLFEACWRRLGPGGRLVASAVTLESEASLIAWHTRYGGELVRLHIARAERIGSSYGWRQMMPITQWAVRKL